MSIGAEDRTVPPGYIQGVLLFKKKKPREVASWAFSWPVSRVFANIFWGKCRCVALDKVLLFTQDVLNIYVKLLSSKLLPVCLKIEIGFGFYHVLFDKNMPKDSWCTCTCTCT